MTKRLTVTLPDGDYEFVQRLSRRFNGNASAAVQQLVGLGRQAALADDYAAAHEEWVASGEATLWESADTPLPPAVTQPEPANP
jgi:hypothetical protein